MAWMYIITHPSSGVFYIGSATCHLSRRDEHNSRLRNNVHHCKKLQDAYNANSDLVWEFQETETREEAYALEKSRIAQHAGDPGLLNMQYNGYKPVISEKARAATSASKLGTPLSDIHRKRISQGMLRGGQSPETVQRLADKLKKDICVEGVVYKGYADVAQKYNVNMSTVLRRLKSANPLYSGWFHITDKEQ